MTAQIGDIYKYKDKEYSIIALSSGLPFCPEDYGMEPHISSTACRRGYWCTYVVDDVLKLDELYLYNNDGKYPQINGVEIDNDENESRLKYDGHRVYRNINLEIPYTGKILVGEGFIQEYYIHMGFQRYWAYEELLELVFENGILTETNDYSDKAQKKRDWIIAEGINPRYADDVDDDADDDAVKKFVENSFSLDYGVKANFL